MLMDAVQTETLYYGDRKISIRTSVLEEKATACNMLCCYADELEVGFFPYVEQVCCHDDIRASFKYSVSADCPDAQVSSHAFFFFLSFQQPCLGCLTCSQSLQQACNVLIAM